jgi:phage terminase small subunit
MPVLSNAKHERYCQNRVDGQTIHEAYINAGYKPNRGNAARLNAKESIRARIRELQGNAAELVERSLAECLAELEAIAYANLGDYIRIDEDGYAHPDFSKATDAKAAGLKEFTVEEREVGRGKNARVVRRLRLKTHDKLRALVQLIEFKIAEEERQKAAVEAAQGQAVSRDDETDHLAEIGRRFARARERYRGEQRAKADMEGEADAPKRQNGVGHGCKTNPNRRQS